MNQEQVNACNQLTRALNKCHHAGLQGGVYDRCFCVWPRDTVIDFGVDGFFETVVRTGTEISTDMSLDGGAGI
jgi:hypothetical protein